MVSIATTNDSNGRTTLPFGMNLTNLKQNANLVMTHELMSTDVGLYHSDNKQCFVNINIA